MRKWALAVVMSVNTHGYASDPQPATGNCQPGTSRIYSGIQCHRNQKENQVQDPRPGPGYVLWVCCYMRNDVGFRGVYRIRLWVEKFWEKVGQ